MASIIVETEIHKLPHTSSGHPRIVFVSGVFNILHPGHLRLLQFAKECGDLLIVGVVKNPLTQEFMTADLRLEAVKVLGFVDYVFMQSTASDQVVANLKPYAVVKGKEHENRINIEAEVLKGYGGKLIFGSGDISFSSHELLSLEFENLDRAKLTLPEDFMLRHQFSRYDLSVTLQKFKQIRVCVIGDVIVDEYISCTPLGMSQEDPTIVVSPMQSEMFVGGAAIVAAHARSLGAQVTFFSVTGQDQPRNFTEAYLKKCGIKYSLFEDPSRPTTLKQRFRAENKTLLRVSHLRQHDIGEDIAENIYTAFRDKAETFDLVIFSDFNYGILTQPLVDRINLLCEERSIPMVADSQSSSQVGDIARFKGMKLITPTEREARLAMRDFTSGLVVLAEKLRDQARAENVFITLGGDGLLIHADTNANNQMLTDNLPVFNHSPKDVAGAGDSLLAASAMAFVVGAGIWQAAFLGSLAAACQVGRLGNIPLRYEEILQEIHQ